MQRADSSPLTDSTRTAEPAPVSEPAANSIDSADFVALDSRVINLWRVAHLFGSLVILTLALIGGLIVGAALRGAWPVVLALWLALAGLRTWLFFWHPARRFRAWGYRIDDKVLLIRSGIWFRVIQLLPLSRLQHVDLHSGPLERRFGLASLVLYTAGTHEASLVIPGLDAQQAARLRDRLVAAGGDDAV